jgi:hypothetical protein
MERKAKFRIWSLTLLPISATESRVDMSVATSQNPEDADESVAFSLLIGHTDSPTLRELELEALRRAQDVLASQASALSQVINHRK